MKKLLELTVKTLILAGLTLGFVAILAVGMAKDYDLRQERIAPYKQEHLNNL